MKTSNNFTRRDLLRTASAGIVAPFFIPNLISAHPSDTVRLGAFGSGNMAFVTIRVLANHPSVANIIRKRLQLLFASTETTPEAAADDGGSTFTGRERMVLELLSSGLSNKEIGRMLALSDNTIKFHLRNIFAKLNVSTRTAAVMAARQKGIFNR